MECENCNRETEIRVIGEDPHCPYCRYACGARLQKIDFEFDGNIFEVVHEAHGVNWNSLLEDVAAKFRPQKESPTPPSWWRRMLGAK